MLKQSHTATRSIASSKRSNLYDAVRHDLFEDTRHRSHRKKINTPSITTICLLQIQAYIIQMLANLPTFTATKSPPHRPLSIYYLIQQKKLYATSSLKSALIQCLRWALLIILLLLDNLARMLDVEREMAHITRQLDVEKEDSFSTETYHHQDPCANRKSPNNHESVEPSLATKPTLVSPLNSPTPNFLVRKTRHSFTNATEAAAAAVAAGKRAFEKSPVFGPIGTRVGHARSLSNNMIDQKQPMSAQKLRRITAQREISMQNGISLKKSSHKHDHHHHHHHHHTSKKPPVSNSVASRSSSESSSIIKETHDKPRMQKTMSLSTAQQYHKKEELEMYSVKKLQRDPMSGVVQHVQQPQEEGPPSFLDYYYD